MEVTIGVVILISMLILGICLIYSWVIVLSKPGCPQQMIEYRFVPRTFEEYQQSPAYPSEVLGDILLARPLNI